MYTVYVKSFEGENFRGFCRILLTANILPWKIFLECWCCPLTTQSMVPPCSYKQWAKHWNVTWHVAYYVTTFLMATSYRSLGFPSSLSQTSFSPITGVQYMITVEKTVSFEFSYFFCHSACVKCDCLLIRAHHNLMSCACGLSRDLLQSTKFSTAQVFPTH